MTALHKPAMTLLLALTLGGCSMAPTYERPEAPVAQNWSGPAARPGAAASQLDWQTFIVDSELRELVNVALDNNRSLRQTLLDIEQARAQYRIQRADRVPGLNAAANGNRQRLPADLSSSGGSAVSSSYQVGLALPEYELDLFGRVKSLTDAALEQYLSTEEAGRSARLALIAEVSQAYLTYDGAQRRLQLTEQTLASREDSLSLIGQRRTAGAATALDYQEALGLVEQSRAELESNARQKQQALNALVLLLGTADAARRIPQVPQDKPMLIQDIAPGTPSELIERRPDILAAEHVLKARNADIGAARAAFFPRISLTAFGGAASTELDQLFRGANRAWSFAPSLSLPIFDAGRNRSNLELAEVRKNLAVVQYEQTVQNAFRDVADALSAQHWLERQVGIQQRAVQTQIERARLSRLSYDNGASPFLDVLDAERNLISSQQQLVQTRRALLSSRIALYAALGGGTQDSGDAPLSSTQPLPTAPYSR